MSNVTELKPGVVGEGFRFDPDMILEKAKGQGFSMVCVIGRCPGGELWISYSDNAAETIMLLERTKHKLLFGE